MTWNWDAKKDKANKRKHGLSFALAQLVFNDPLALSRVDDFESEERWQTVGLIGGVTVFVVHTVSVSRADEGRIISARKATRHERKAYEDGTF
jgi:uncharacterized protein